MGTVGGERGVWLIERRGLEGELVNRGKVWLIKRKGREGICEGKYGRGVGISIWGGIKMGRGGVKE